MQVRNWMTETPITAHAGEPLKDAYRRMMEYDIRHLPVMDNDRLVGMVTTIDVGRRLAAATEASWSEAEVRDVMTPDPLYTDGNTEIAHAALTMLNARVSSLPVMDGDRLVGIITTDDMLRALVVDEEAARPTT